MTARMKTRLVVRRGSTGIGFDEESGEGREREKRRAGGAKRERVPVPVLCIGEHRIQLEIRKALRIPVRAMLAVLKDVPDQTKVLMFLVWMGEDIPFNLCASFCLRHCSYNSILLLRSGS